MDAQQDGLNLRRTQRVKRTINSDHTRNIALDPALGTARRRPPGQCFGPQGEGTPGAGAAAAGFLIYARQG